MLRKIFSSQTKNITSAAFLLALSGLASDFLALARDRLLAGRFGAGAELDVYFAAFRIPDFIYGLLVMGGISAVFLPVFSGVFHKNEEKGWDMINNSLNILLIVIVLLSGVLAILTPLLVDFMVPGFSALQKSQTVDLTRLMFLSPILFGLSAVMSGCLQYFNKFLVYSLAPLLYNIGIILGILFLAPVFGTAGLVYGVIVGAFLHFAVQIPAAWHSGWKYRLKFDLGDSGVKKIIKLGLPRTIGTAAYNINLIVITAIASGFSAGSIAIFNFANNLQSFPIGIVGSSFALAAFPALSRSWAEGKKNEFFAHFSLALRQALLLVIPAGLLMFLLRAQIVRLILGTGQFGWMETRLTAAALGIFSLGLFAAALIPLLSRAFFALHNTKTPVLISLAAMALNVFLAFILVRIFSSANVLQNFMASVLDVEDISNAAILGLPLAVSVAGIFQFFALFLMLKKGLADFSFKVLWASVQKVIIASALMTIFVYWVIKLSGFFLDLHTFIGVFAQTLIAGIAGVLVYIAVLVIMKSSELKDLAPALLRRALPRVF